MKHTFASEKTDYETKSQNYAINRLLMYIDDAQGTLNHKKEVFDLIYF
jgi:hypothetical protein